MKKYVYALYILICLLFAGFEDPLVAHAQEDTPPPTATIIPTPAPLVNDMAATDLTAEQWLGLFISLVVVLVLAHFLAVLLVWVLQRLTRRTGTSRDDELLHVIRPQISWFFAALGFQFATFRLPLDEDLTSVLNNLYFILYWFVITMTAWRSINFIIKQYSVVVIARSKDKALSKRGVALLERLGRIMVIFIAAVVLLNHFGVNMLAVSAALGLSGFAIGLAAKDTVTNVISGLVIMFDHPFTIGERIEVPDLGTWGDVTEIGIRTTKVITRDNRQVVIPNASIVDNNVVNYSLPDPTYRLQTDIGIGSAEDIGRVVRLFKEAIEGVDGVLAEKPVDVLFIGFGDFSNTFRIRWWVSTYADKRRVTHRVCTVIQDVAIREGITMPYPTYVLDSVKFHGEDVRVLPESTSPSDSSRDEL